MRWFNPGFVTRPPLYVAWNTLDRTSNIVLSSGNLDALISSNAAANVRATLQRSTGKYYCEITMVLVDKPATGAGLATASRSLSATMFSDNAVQALIMFRDGTIYLNGSFIAAGSALANNDVVRIAYDQTNKRAWLARNGDNWNGTVGADPETNVSGITTLVLGAALFPIWGGGDSNQECLANFGTSAFAYTVPTGFSAWNSS